MADPDKGEVITGAPLVVKNMVITGVAGAEYGIRGWIAATDLETGKEVWRTYTIPGPGEPGHETWKDSHNAAATGGGSTWVTGTYDPATNTLLWGIGNPGPDWDNEYRPGDNLYTDSTLASMPTPVRSSGTSRTRRTTRSTTTAWPRTCWSTCDRRRQKLAVTPTATASPMRSTATGAFVWGVPFVKKVSWTKGLDPETGKPVEYDPQGRSSPISASPTAKPWSVICPGNMGGKNWPPTAYNPNLGLWYIPVIESCNRSRSSRRFRASRSSRASSSPAAARASPSASRAASPQSTSRPARSRASTRPASRY